MTDARHGAAPGHGGPGAGANEQAGGRCRRHERNAPLVDLAAERARRRPAAAGGVPAWWPPSCARAWRHLAAYGLRNAASYAVLDAEALAATGTGAP